MAYPVYDAFKEDPKSEQYSEVIARAAELGRMFYDTDASETEKDRYYARYQELCSAVRILTNDLVAVYVDLAFRGNLDSYLNNDIDD